MLPLKLLIFSRSLVNLRTPLQCCNPTGKSFEVEKLDDLPSFPFCGDRCRMVDLGRWIDGAYAIPGPAQQEPTSVPEAEEDDD